MASQELAAAAPLPVSEGQALDTTEDKRPPGRAGAIGAGGVLADRRGLPDHPSDLHKVKTLKKSKKE